MNARDPAALHQEVLRIARGQLPAPTVAILEHLVTHEPDLFIVEVDSQVRAGALVLSREHQRHLRATLEPGTGMAG
ncbi:MAG: hypothetical protein J7518_00565 [Nocardioidaceae bacterium]|nr:hypothetical protein [Nocardioidaceae bacterium]